MLLSLSDADKMITKSEFHFEMSSPTSNIVSTKLHYLQDHQQLHHTHPRSYVIIFFWAFLGLSLFACDHLCVSSSTSLSSPKLEISSLQPGSHFDRNDNQDPSRVQSNLVLSSKIADVLHAINERHHRQEKATELFQMPLKTSSVATPESHSSVLESSQPRVSPAVLPASMDSIESQQQDMSETLQDSPTSLSSSVKMMSPSLSLLTNRVEHDYDMDYRNPGSSSKERPLMKTQDVMDEDSSRVDSRSNLTLSNKRIKTSSTIDPETTVGCYRREYFFKAERTDASGLKCWSTVKTVSCWGRCETGEVSCTLFIS